MPSKSSPESSKLTPRTYTYGGTITTARVRGVNGPDTARQLTLSLHAPMHDGDGTFDGLLALHIPVRFSEPLGDRPDLEGKKIRVVVLIDPLSVPEHTVEK